MRAIYIRNAGAGSYLLTVDTEKPTTIELTKAEALTMATRILWRLQPSYEEMISASAGAAIEDFADNGTTYLDLRGKI